MTQTGKSICLILRTSDFSALSNQGGLMHPKTSTSDLDELSSLLQVNHAVFHGFRLTNWDFQITFDHF